MDKISKQARYQSNSLQFLGDEIGNPDTALHIRGIQVPQHLLTFLLLNLLNFHIDRLDNGIALILILLLGLFRILKAAVPNIVRDEVGQRNDELEHRYEEQKAGEPKNKDDAAVDGVLFVELQNDDDDDGHEAVPEQVFADMLVFFYAVLLLDFQLGCGAFLQAFGAP